MSHRAVYKTTMAEVLDDFYGGTARQRTKAFDQAEKMLRSQGSLSQSTATLEEQYGKRMKGSQKHFEDHWLAPSGTYGQHAIEPVLRLGYREAIKLARRRGVPIETFWITGASTDFELHICEGTDRIVCFMFVPSDDKQTYGSDRAQSRSWVVREGDIAVDETAPRRVLNRGEKPIVMVQMSGRKGRAKRAAN